MGSPQHTSSSQKLAVAMESEEVPQPPSHVAQLSAQSCGAAWGSPSPSGGVGSVGRLGLQGLPDPLKTEVPETQETSPSVFSARCVLGRGKQHRHSGFQESHFEHSV